MAKNPGAQSNFTQYQTLTLKAAGAATPGVSQNPQMTGNKFICVQADYPFQMSFSGGSQWFQFDQGLEWELDSGNFLSQLWFRNPPGQTNDNNIAFYFGSVKLLDGRISIVRNSSVTQSVPIQNAQCRTVSHVTAVLANGGNESYPGTNNGTRRKSIIITNLDATKNLDVKDSAGVVCATVFPQQAWILETDADLKLGNSSGGGISRQVLETFYKNAQ